MGQYKTTHQIKPHWVGLITLKESTITDKETGNKGEGRVGTCGSYEEADRRALKDLQRKNREDKED